MFIVKWVFTYSAVQWLWKATFWIVYYCENWGEKAVLLHKGPLLCQCWVVFLHLVAITRLCKLKLAQTIWDLFVCLFFMSPLLLKTQLQPNMIFVKKRLYAPSKAAVWFASKMLYKPGLCQVMKAVKCVYVTELCGFNRIRSPVRHLKN